MAAAFVSSHNDGYTFRAHETDKRQTASSNVFDALMDTHDFSRVKRVPRILQASVDVADDAKAHSLHHHEDAPHQRDGKTR